MAAKKVKVTITFNIKGDPEDMDVLKENVYDHLQSEIDDDTLDFEVDEDDEDMEDEDLFDA